MKRILPLLLTSISLTACSEISYGPSQCARPPVFQQADLATDPQVSQTATAPAPIMQTIAPQNLAPSAFTPTPAPQEAAPMIVIAPFMMGPSIAMPDYQAQQPAPNAAKPASNEQSQTITAPAAAEAASGSGWLHM